MAPKRNPKNLTRNGICSFTSALLAFSGLVTLGWVSWISYSAGTLRLEGVSLRASPTAPPAAPSVTTTAPSAKTTAPSTTTPAPPATTPASPATTPALLGPRVSCGSHSAAVCADCTLGHDNGWCNGDCVILDGACRARPPPQGGTPLHPAYIELIREYEFQPVRTDSDDLVNIILVRSPFRSSHVRSLYERYKDDILFLGISSFEDYPLPPPNPFSQTYPADEYVGLFPGFLQMFRDTSVFPPTVKTILMSESDFSQPHLGRIEDKKYDFVFSGTDQDVWNECVGWSSYAKNWTWVVESLEVMCGEFGLTGVLVATKDKEDRLACSIPRSCDGKILQTTYLENQNDFHHYVKQSHFAYVPQIHDASPRAAAESLGLGTPVLMNWHIMGGWKYVNEQTGEFFHDMSDFREQLSKVLRNSKAGVYRPAEYMAENYGVKISGTRLKVWIEKEFSDRVRLPTGTQYLLPSGA